MLQVTPPLPGEYSPYAVAYISKVPPEGHIISYLQTNATELIQLIQSFTEDQLLYRYAPGKWTVKEVLNHITDTERIFLYRAFCIARGEQQPLQGHEQDDFERAAQSNHKSILSLLSEYETVRNSTIAFFRYLEESNWMRWGVANNHPVTVRALAYQIIGHEAHHVQILNQRYLH